MKSSEEKKVYMLLKSVIFHYHGLDEAERIDLEKTAVGLDAHAEHRWALEFIAKDYITAFERAREYLNEIIADYPQLSDESIRACLAFAADREHKFKIAS